MCPANNESAGRRRPARRRNGNEHLQSLAGGVRLGSRPPPRLAVIGGERSAKQARLTKKQGEPLAKIAQGRRAPARSPAPVSALRRHAGIPGCLDCVSLGWDKCMGSGVRWTRVASERGPIPPPAGYVSGASKSVAAVSSIMADRRRRSTLYLVCRPDWSMESKPASRSSRT